MKVAVLGSGTMGRGIAQISALHGHETVVYDASQGALETSRSALLKIFDRLVEKGRLERAQASDALERMTWSSNLNAIEGSKFVLEAIIEDLEEKSALLSRVEAEVSRSALIGSNTSSLSIAALGSCLKAPDRFLGVHFFNPAPLMPLVEVVPGIATELEVVDQVVKLMEDWGKLPVKAKDTPGFIVNRVARPFYGEALRIVEEQIADVATVDWAMKELGGFKMGPFELMDLIGNDINFAVTTTVFAEFFYDPRYRPSILQKRMVEAGLLGKKSNRGYYDYSERAEAPRPISDQKLGNSILMRILSMLVNEAAEALRLGIASARDLELAMTKGVNYPKGLLAWANELGVENVLAELRALSDRYGEDRYRPSPLIRELGEQQRSFEV